jgi:hypothetical protein
MASGTTAPAFPRRFGNPLSTMWKSSQLIDAERLAPQSGLQTGFELIQEKANGEYWP